MGIIVSISGDSTEGVHNRNTITLTSTQTAYGNNETEFYITEITYSHHVKNSKDSPDDGVIFSDLDQSISSFKVSDVFRFSQSFTYDTNYDWGVNRKISFMMRNSTGSFTRYVSESCSEIFEKNNVYSIHGIQKIYDKNYCKFTIKVRKRDLIWNEIEGSDGTITSTFIYDPEPPSFETETLTIYDTINYNNDLILNKLDSIMQRTISFKETHRKIELSNTENKNIKMYLSSEDYTDIKHAEEVLNGDYVLNGSNVLIIDLNGESGISFKLENNSIEYEKPDTSFIDSANTVNSLMEDQQKNVNAEFNKMLEEVSKINGKEEADFLKNEIDSTIPKIEIEEIPEIKVEEIEPQKTILKSGESFVVNSITMKDSSEIDIETPLKIVVVSQ